MSETDRVSLLIKKHEGYRDKIYPDSLGILTIGYGRNLEGVGISRAEAEILFDNDFRRANKDLYTNFPWFRNLDFNQKAAMIDMCYNLGLTRFSTFKKMIHHMENKNYTSAAEEMLNSKWAEQVGDRAHELAGLVAGAVTVDDILTS